MYNEQSISSLETRIGWERSLDTDFEIELNEEVLTADSERKVNSFHQLVIVDNIYAAVQEVDMEAAKFNGFLASVRRQSTIEVLTSVFDKCELYDEDVDYSDTIIKRPKLFDDAIGYSMAIKMLELFMASPRINAQEINTKMSFNALKIELEGVRNDGGFYVAKGIKYELKTAITKTQRILFPIIPLVKKGPSW
jgi:hypothetical protein